ncbi:MAG: YceI family protein [Bacteroidales bacterium]|nr:YceI family protein [Bacteroidales bacterium]MCB9000146.1 YceI family protein [Bacteroidales bacterium]MCB9013503.1 YceI family protein [Bacteroidales bacterium]
MKNILILLFLALGLNLNAQKFIAKNGFAGFYSHTSMEDIKADNNQVNSILDTSNGEIVFLMLNKSFHFDRALMEEHFNENYMESEKFPKSTFKGRISNLSDVNFNKPGVYKVTVEGKMNMHGVEKDFTTEGTLEVQADGIVAKATFPIKPEDYGIAIPGIVRDKIASEMTVNVNVKYTLMNR